MVNRIDLINLPNEQDVWYNFITQKHPAIHKNDQDRKKLRIDITKAISKVKTLRKKGQKPRDQWLCCPISDIFFEGNYIPGKVEKPVPSVKKSTIYLYFYGIKISI